MVSNNPNPPEGFYLDPNGTALTGFGSSAAASSPEDLSKKIRKPYTITKSRESWTEPEHDKFLEALHLFDRDWKKIEAFIGSKTVIQIRSHAQKYFLKVQKNGTNEHLPPPRPKRKAAHPYPQKASKTAPMLSQPSGSFQSSSAHPEPVRRPESSSIPVNALTTPTAPPSLTNNVPSIRLPDQTRGNAVATNCCSSTESTPGTRQVEERIEMKNHGQRLRILPDFVQVYLFIGSVFDPNATGHLQRLKNMDPIDAETVLLLMRNLSINLTSPAFADHRRLFSSYEIESDPIGASLVPRNDQVKNIA